jgi:hypothetical protein
VCVSIWDNSGLMSTFLGSFKQRVECW